MKWKMKCPKFVKTDNYLKDLGQIIKIARYNHSMTQYDVAKLTSIKQGTISQIERGKHRTSMIYIIIVCKLLHIKWKQIGECFEYKY